MFRIIKKMFIVLVTSLINTSSIVNTSNHTKCVSLSNKKCEVQPTFVNLHPNEYSQESHYYPFAVQLDKCVGSCNALNDLPNRACIDLNIHVFNMITGKN